MCSSVYQYRAKPLPLNEMTGEKADVVVVDGTSQRSLRVLQLLAHG